jgi:hypothetical protein
MSTAYLLILRREGPRCPLYRRRCSVCSPKYRGSGTSPELSTKMKRLLIIHSKLRLLPVLAVLYVIPVSRLKK